MRDPARGNPPIKFDKDRKTGQSPEQKSVSVTNPGRTCPPVAHAKHLIVDLRHLSISAKTLK